MDACRDMFVNGTYDATEGFCPSVWDTLLCWPPTALGRTVHLGCPAHRGVDTSKYAFRKCSDNGYWETKNGTDDLSGKGWTNYTDCYYPEIRNLMRKLYRTSPADAEQKLKVAEVTRTLEMVGLSLSFISLVVSLVIFSVFRKLRNKRTKLHMNLFVAMMIQVLVRLAVYIDQYVTRKSDTVLSTGIDSAPILCESFYILMEYARTAMFMWMFVEGVHLHLTLTVRVFHEIPDFRWYYFVGWGLPVVLTAIWATVTGIYYLHTSCWWGYNLLPYYWIQEGPRLAVITLNLFFLLNIIRVLVTKLKTTFNDETQQARKAVKGAIVLLPLLGITNYLLMVHNPIDSDAFQFAAWSYTTSFLAAFQGFFVALLYCFMNEEVRLAIMKSWEDYYLQKYPHKTHRYSTVRMRYAAAREREPETIMIKFDVSPGPQSPEVEKTQDLL